MFSIDQNCHSLWDVVPKLHALAGRGHFVTHFIEDLDTAFTAIGAKCDDAELRLARERYYPDGRADWGAALFYSEFLGRLPVDVRAWEPFTGMKTAALARRLGRSEQDLYDEFSPGDNWQLIGSSYVGDRDHHRLIGDLSVAETEPLLRELLARARADVQRSFPAHDARERAAEWFDQEETRLVGLLDLHADSTLAELYRDWLCEHCGELGAVNLDMSSRLFSLRSSAGASRAPLEVFLRDYDTAAALYNEAVAETDCGLRPLKTAEGELPFFAALERSGHAVRSGVFLREGALRIGGRDVPLAGERLPTQELLDAGVRCLAGKAVLLVIQVRTGPTGDRLAVPHRGSLYMPAADRFLAKLAEGGLLRGPVRPVVRVRLRLLERMRSLETIIRLPDHLARCLGRQDVPARVLGDCHAALADEARARLESFLGDDGRRRWQRENCPRLFAEIDALDRRRRELARVDPKSQEIRQASHRVRRLETQAVDALLRRIADDVQLRDLDYWDSRGALMPWAVALGGWAFYDELVSGAELYEEPVPAGLSA